MKICEENLCTGCSACINVCSRGAIQMLQGVNGHLFPVVNKSLCVECKACQKCCPNNNTITYHSPLRAYIASAKNSEDAQMSTSAGVASIIARKLLQTGGVVYGCSGCDVTNIRHIRVCDESSLYKLKGSKYVQSVIADTFSSVKKDLESRLRVLFIGTPCQVAGLYSFLRKPYEHLFTIDLICHGVPSQQILNDALREYLPGVNLKEVSLNFRHKSKGNSAYGLFVKNQNGDFILNSKFPRNEYITGFLSGLFYRESCYQCRYSRPERISDITLGDYWDHENNVKMNNKQEGLSMLIVNTSKGASLVSKISPFVNLLDGNYADFVKRNGQLHHPIKKSMGYAKFSELYPQIGFINSAKIGLRDDLRRIKRNIAINRLSSIIYTIPGVKLLRYKIKNK